MLSFDVLLILSLILIALLLLAGATMAMTISWSITETGEGSGIASQQTTSQTGEGPIIKTWTVPTAAVDEDNEITFTVANLKMMVITSTKDITIKENSSGAPTATFTIKANVPFEWHKDGGVPVPFVGTAGVVTKFFISNPGAGDATVKARGLQ